MNRRRLVAVIALALNAASWAGPCRAALGGDSSSIASDQNALRGALSSTQTPQYRIEEISTAAGIHVREYLSAGGMIFAVAWSGPAVPDLQLLLGTYYGEYMAALRKLKPQGIRRSARIEGQSVDVELAGHMRAYSGRAYLPAQVPAGASIGEIR